MSFLADKRKKRVFIVVASVAAVLAVILVACAGYLGDYYHADMAAIEAFTPVNEEEQIIFTANTITGFLQGN